MKAGPELDALVAEKVMGLVPCEHWTILHHGGLSGAAYWLQSGSCPTHGGHPEEPQSCYPREQCCQYSTNIQAAWQVLESLKDWRFSLHGPCDEVPQWCATFTNYGYRSFQDLQVEERADTAPLAICLAALKVVRAVA